MFLRMTMIGMLAVGLSSCGMLNKDDAELRSPCAGTDESPCGTKRPVNDWWLKEDVS